VRAYAAELQLDPERTLAEFLAQFPELQAESEPVASIDATRPAHIWRVAAQLAVILVPLTTLIVWALVGARAREPQTASDRTLVAQPDAAAAALLHPVSSPAAASPEAVPALQQGTMRVVLTMKSDCWVSAMADSRPVVERLMRAGESVELTATRSVIFKAGDAGAVALQINGETGRSLGRAGQVVTTRIDSSTVHDFLATP
jgi:cytoskeletal protein RodZ